MPFRIVLGALLAAGLILADSAAGLQWTPPAAWKAQGARPMRAATYQVPPAAGDTEPAECGVYYFGPTQGGSVDANIDRWVGQFTQSNGKPSHDAAQIRKRTIHGFSVTTIDVSGAYAGMGGPMAASHTEKPGYRLLGAIVAAPEGNVFFKFTGPAKTIAANQAAFDKMLNSAHQ